MEPAILLQGIIIGISIAAPVGPIGVLCIRRTLADGRRYGLAAGLGAATADGLYGAVAGFGIAAISSLLLAQATWLRLFGGLFLCYLGVRTLLARPAAQAAGARGSDLLGTFFSTFLLTLTNPLTILSFAAIFAGLGAGAQAGYLGATTLVLGVFCGSALWWLLLSGGVSLFRDALNAARLLWVNRISGAIVAGFGLLALLSLVE